MHHQDEVFITDCESLLPSRFFLPSSRDSQDPTVQALRAADRQDTILRDRSRCKLYASIEADSGKIVSEAMLSEGNRVIIQLQTYLDKYLDGISYLAEVLLQTESPASYIEISRHNRIKLYRILSFLYDSCTEQQNAFDDSDLIRMGNNMESLRELLTKLNHRQEEYVQCVDLIQKMISMVDQIK